MRALRRLWLRISEPRHLKLFFLGVYALTLAVGVVTVVKPPQSIEGALGYALTLFWAALIIVGAIGAGITVLPGWWWAERASVVLILAGIAIYEGLAVVLHVVGPPGSSRLTQAGFILLAAAVFILRLLLTRKWDFEPRR